MNPKFGGGVDLDNISDGFEGQGHRSKVKVTRLKNVIFSCIIFATYKENDCSKDFLLGILTKRARRGRGVNAQAFSFKLINHQRIKLQLFF